MARHPATEGNDLAPNRVDAREDVTISEKSVKKALDSLSIKLESVWEWGTGTPTASTRSNPGVVFMEEPYGYDDYVVMVGGYDGANNPTTTTQEYDIQWDSWYTNNYLDTPRAEMATTVYDGEIYLFGGETDTEDPTASAVKVNLPDNTTYPLADMPVANDGQRAVTVGDKIYIIGGNSAKNLEYDPAEDTYTDIGYPIYWGEGDTMWHPSAVAYDGNVYVSGGYAGSGFHGEVVEYNPDTGNWDFKDNLNTKVYGHSMAAVEGHLYIMGGYDLDYNVLSTVQVFDISAETWGDSMTMPGGKLHTEAAYDTIRSAIVVPSGKGTGGNDETTTYEMSRSKIVGASLEVDW